MTALLSSLLPIRFWPVTVQASAHLPRSSNILNPSRRLALPSWFATYRGRKRRSRQVIKVLKGKLREKEIVILGDPGWLCNGPVDYQIGNVWVAAMTIKE